MGLDQLTGLPGWTELRDAMQAVFATRAGVGVGLLRVNIDRLGQVNNEVGEQAGDQVLLDLVSLIRRTTLGRDAVLFRASDIAILLPAASANEALRIASETTDSAEGIQLPNGTPLSVSIGVGHLTVRGGSDPAGLLDLADSALRTAKHHGPKQISIETR